MPPPHLYSSSRQLHPPRRRMNVRLLRATTVAATLIFVCACRDVGPAFGPSIPAARANAEGLFGGIAQRFTNVQRNPKFAIARGKLGKNALTPSVIFNDTSVWTSMSSDNSRMVTVEGEFGTSKYVFSAKPTTTVANEPGDSRHTMVLRKVGDNEFDWFTNVEIAAGTVTANDLRNVLSAWMKSAERRSPATIRDDYRSSFPRTTASLARLFSLDSLRVTNDADGATTIFLG